MATVYWHMTKATYEEYLRIFEDAVSAAQANDTLKYQQAESELQSLPGYPRGIHPDLDRVQPVVDYTSQRIVTFGSIH